MPRPSQAPSMPVEDLVLPEAAPESPLEYSPVITPEGPQQVDSSTSSTSSDVSDDIYTTDVIWQQLVTLSEAEELCPEDTIKFWQSADDHIVRSLFAPDWTKLLTDHACVQSGSTKPDSTEKNSKVLRWLHTSEGTFKTLLEKGS
eukprot:203184-Amphidinium_carterae.1